MIGAWAVVLLLRHVVVYAMMRVCHVDSVTLRDACAVVWLWLWLRHARGGSLRQLVLDFSYSSLVGSPNFLIFRAYSVQKDSLTPLRFDQAYGPVHSINTISAVKGVIPGESRVREQLGPGRRSR